MMTASVHIYPWVLPILGGALGLFFSLWDSARRRLRIMQRIIDIQSKEIKILEEITAIRSNKP